jgi:hypothetical protein
MARDAIARLYDVDARLMKLTPLPHDKRPNVGNYLPGLIEFEAKKGKSVDLDQMHESISATRLSGNTNMRMDYLEITIRGQVTERGKDLILTVSGTGQELVLGDDVDVKGGLEKLRKALADGAKVTTVTGRVQGWFGRFPEVMSAWGKTQDQKRTLGVISFEDNK